MAARKTLGRSPLQFLSLGKRTMAKEKTTTNQQDGQHKHCPNTVFVSNFPYSFTNSQAPSLSLSLHIFIHIYDTYNDVFCLNMRFGIECVFVLETLIFQLEETFSEVGPIRRCFMVAKKGTIFQQ